MAIHRCSDCPLEVKGCPLTFDIYEFQMFFCSCLLTLISFLVSLLQKQFGNVDLEIIEETNRGKNVPLLVVLYNLSRLTDDAKGALRDIEGWKILSYSCSRSAC
jgi:hypothetical protein